MPNNTILEKYNIPIRAQLYWVQDKARPAYLCTDKSELVVAKNLLKDNTAEYNNIIYKEAFIRKLKKNNGSEYNDIIHLFYHKDNQDTYEKHISELQKRYSCILVGQMLGYLQPQDMIESEYDYKNKNTTATLYWYVNKKLAFCEGIKKWSEVSKNKSHLEKFKLLAKSLPEDFTLELKIVEHSKTMITSKDII
jgi:hypothetical protein